MQRAYCSRSGRRVSRAELTRKEGRTKDDMKDWELIAQMQIVKIQIQDVQIQIQITADQGRYLEPN